MKKGNIILSALIAFALGYMFDMNFSPHSTKTYKKEKTAQREQNRSNKDRDNKAATTNISDHETDNIQEEDTHTEHTQKDDLDLANEMANQQQDDPSTPPDESSLERFSENHENFELTTVEETATVPIPEQQNIPKGRDKAYYTNIRKKADYLISIFEREQNKYKKTGTGYSSEEFTFADWKTPEEIEKKLTARLLEKVGKANEKAVWNYLSTPGNRIDLARLQLIRKAGIENLHFIAKQKMGAQFLCTISSDLTWMNGLLYSGPTKNLGVALLYMTELYRNYTEDMGDPNVRRLATATALEFAKYQPQSKLSASSLAQQGPNGYCFKTMRERFSYFLQSYQKGKLNAVFDKLQYWDTRIVVGFAPNGYGANSSLIWQRDNCNLPAEEYVGAHTQCPYKMKNVAGDHVYGHAREYVGPLLKYAGQAIAHVRREMGGVCLHLSQYGAHAALAHGVPAMTMGEPNHLSYTVRVGKEWVRANSVGWQHQPTNLFWGAASWDFLILTQNVYSDEHRTLVSDMLVALGELFAAHRMTKSAFDCYEAAILAQPLNYPAFVANISYLKQKAPTHKEKWKELHNHIIQGMAKEYHHAAAVLLSRLVYPDLLALEQNLKEQNKLFAAFFRQCKDYGHNRWYIDELLDAQLKGCSTTKEKRQYLRDSLSVLMRKPHYAANVLSWGVDYMGKLPDDEENGELKEEFFDLLISTMNRSRTGKKDTDNTWTTLGNAIISAGRNNDEETFYAIGKVAFRKCKKKFPNKKTSFRRFSGNVVSEKGLITTAAILQQNQENEAALHWGCLQPCGGDIPLEMHKRMQSGVTVKLEQESALNGVVIRFSKVWDWPEPIYLIISEDGRTWTRPEYELTLTGPIARFDFKKRAPKARYVRLTVDGDYQGELGGDASIQGFYVYGKDIRKHKDDGADES